MAREAAFQERVKRRSAIAYGRALRTRPGGAPKHPSLFFHFPKCGGTSLSEAMYATIPLSQRIGVLDALSTRRATAMLHHDKDDIATCHEDLEFGQQTFDFREGLMLQHMAWDTMLIHGHVFWSDKFETFFKDKYKIVTLMRDPMDRAISNFRMVQRAGIFTGNFKDYVQSDIARRQARVYLRYLVGRNDITDAELPGAINLAKSRIGKFALVGFLDDLDSFLTQYRDLFGVTLRIPKLNAAPSREPDNDPASMAILKELCGPDIDIWNSVRKFSGKTLR
jgi:hypothetical protein